MGERSTRREFLGTAAAGVACVALAGVTGCQITERPRAVSSPTPNPPGVWAFRSRPDLRPPAVRVVEKGRGLSRGYVFLAPKKGPEEQGPGQDGPLILDNDGLPMWFRPAPPGDRDVMGFRAQSYRGRPVLTWWGGVHGGYGNGEYVIFDDSYREVKRFPAGDGYPGDHHEFLITPRDTALVTIYAEVPHDLSPLGGPEKGLVMEGVAQEIDIQTGEVIFEWHSLEHVDIEESYYEPSANPADRFDYFHINSIDVDVDQNWLVSARRTSTVYKIDRKTGEVIWRLGGKRSDFAMGEGTGFAYQHDARRQPDGTITLFDNYGPKDEADRSRAVVLEVDEDAMRASLVREYYAPDVMPIADTQGNVQTLPNGNLFVGWGSEPHFSEFSEDGGLLYSARLPAEVESYRAFLLPWSGRPDDAPSLAAETWGEDGFTLYASWNGATEVESWRVLAGPEPDQLGVLGTVPRRGFETVIRARTQEAYVGVQAEDGSGRDLGPATALRLEKRGTDGS